MAQLSNSSRLAAILRNERPEILTEWSRAFGMLPIARDLDHPALIDHVPEFLDRIANIAEDLEAGRIVELPLKAAELHAVGRLGRGFDLGQIVIELALLRDCIITRLWSGHAQDSTLLLELTILNQAIDKAVTASIERFTEARDRTLLEFDQIVATAIAKPDLDGLLQAMVRVLLDRATPEVDTAAILLQDDGRLHVRAAVGLTMDRDFTLRIGEGFAGTIAAERQPRALTSAATDPLIVNPALRAAGVRALYGVPIVDGDEAIGVVHMGSLTVNRFSAQDQHLVAALASRATAAIHQHMLREMAERTTERLRESEMQLQNLADNIPQLAWMADRTGALFWYNRRWFDFTGMTYDDVKDAGWQKVQHPAHLKFVIEKFGRAIATGEVWEDTFPMRGRDGRYRWFLTRAVPIRDVEGNVVRWFGTNTDVTDQRFLAEATKLLGSSLDYHDTLEKLARLAVPECADWCIVDVVEQAGPRRISIAHADPTKTELAREWAERYPPDWKEPRGLAHVIRTGRPEFVREIPDALLVESARDPRQLRTLRALGLVSMIAVPLVARDRTLGALALVMAESGRHYHASDLELATELGRRAGVAIDNARLYREAGDAIRIREKILAIVSHDLRNPLGAIDLSSILVLQDSTLAPPTRRALELIRRSAGRMQRMIGDLLDLARIQSGALTLERAAHDAEELLADSLATHEPIARNKGISVVQELAARGVLVSCDRERIEQVFANLLGNAIKFCRPGDTISVRASRERDHVRYVVADTGPGIPADELPHIFEPYWSARDSTKEGLGLGLHIAKGIIDAHGGEMKAESDGAGATFVVRLPIAAPARSA